jgi:hypothetical protein
MDNLTLLMLLIPVLIIAGFLVSIGREWLTTSRLKRDGVATEAEVIDLVKDAWRGTTNAYVEYSFRATPADGGDKYAYRQAITEAHHDRLQKGDHIVVRYQSGNPNVSRLAGTDEDFATRDAALRRVAVMFVVWLVLMGYAITQRQ